MCDAAHQYPGEMDEHDCKHQVDHDFMGLLQPFSIARLIGQPAGRGSAQAEGQQQKDDQTAGRVVPRVVVGSAS